MEIKNMNNLPRSCQKVAEYSDKQQYAEAGFWEKLRIQIHILHCRHCHAYHIKNEELTRLLQNHQLKFLSKSEKEEIKARLSL
ncbi:hypothetical protein [Psychroflexus sediminis]|uniref:Zinc-finger n=1 Tax=Psychroflexus sediminis TaxID=470826 RepID=A0A1G7VW92_9FLAO|nr:hypothetical protein [Psychroflexus sediminis]SDG64003.1 hypothetical protein SAMN04488027_104212 [Psychroflexus sediminis]